jgi:hypothetical protein
LCKLKFYTPDPDSHTAETSGELTMPQRRLEYLGEGGDLRRTRFQPYGTADDDFLTNPGDNHVAALQNLIYARFAVAIDEPIKAPLLEGNGAFEQTVTLVSRIAGIVAVIAALAVVAIAIF